MRYVLIITIIFICVALVLFGPASMQGAAKGFELFISNVFPALFPFFVCISALKYANALAVGNSRPIGSTLKLFLIACISGSPSGTMLTESIFGGETPLLSERERTELCAITNLASPVFIAGALCSGMLGNAELTPLFMLCHYGTAGMLLGMFLLRNHGSITRSSRPMPVVPSYTQRAERKATPRSAKLPLSAILPAAIRDSAASILQVGGTLVFFMVITSLLDASGILKALNVFTKSILFGTLEMTNGISLLAAAQALPRIKCALICMILSFGGICVFLQACGIAKLRPFDYFKVKLLHAAFSGALCYVLYPLFTARLAPVIGIWGDRLVIDRAVTMSEIALCGALASILASLLAVCASKRTRA